MIRNISDICSDNYIQLSCGSEKLQIILDRSSPKWNLHDDKRSPALASDRNLAGLSERMYSGLLHSNVFHIVHCCCALPRRQYNPCHFRLILLTVIIFLPCRRVSEAAWNYLELLIMSEVRFIILILPTRFLKCKQGFLIQICWSFLFSRSGLATLFCHDGWSILNATNLVSWKQSGHRACFSFYYYENHSGQFKEFIYMSNSFLMKGVIWFCQFLCISFSLGTPCGHFF
jgi:hypothetical protein